MNTEHPIPPAAHAAPPSGRWSNLAGALVLILAVTAIAGIVMFLGARTSRRFDVTASREHELSPQTRRIVESLNRVVTLVVATDLKQVNPLARQRLLDVLEKFERQSDKFQVRIIDTASPSGVAQYDDVLAQLAEADAPAIDAAAQAVTASVVLADEAAAALDTVAGSLASLAQAVGPGAAPRWENFAAVQRVAAADLRKAARESRDAMARPRRPGEAPPIDEAAQPIRIVMERLAADLGGLASAIDQLNTPATDESTRAKLTALAAQVNRLRDGAARTSATLERTARLPLLVVARTIKRSRAILLIDSAPAAPDDPRARITAIDADAFLPSAAGDGGVDLRARIEEMIASGVAAMASSVRPVVVLVHARPQRLAPEFTELLEIRERLSMRGIELLEWAVAVDRAAPIIPPPAAGVSRPVIYVALPTDIRAPEDAARMGRLGDALAQLAQAGSAMLVSVNPSTLPGVGAPDPLVSFLEPLGIKADSGRPLFEEVRSETGRSVSPDWLLTDPGTQHSIARTLAGLRTILIWPIPLTLSPVRGVEAQAVITAPDTPARWGESEWQSYRQVPASQRDRITNPPANDSPRDAAGDSNSWTLAVALERTEPSFRIPQRIVVVGSNLWFLDGILRRAIAIDGRQAAVAPGNAELFMSAVTWLAGQDDLLLRSASAQSVPTIPALTAAQLSALRWLLIAGLPVAVLILGVLYRVMRG